MKESGWGAETGGQECHPGSWGQRRPRLSGRKCGVMGRESSRHLTSKGWAEARACGEGDRGGGSGRAVCGWRVGAGGGVLSLIRMFTNL